MAKNDYRILPDDPNPYFLTATVVNWLPLFMNPQIAAIVLDCLRHLIMSGDLRLYAYVLMENHLHCIASADDLSRQINRFKSYTARKSIDYLLSNQQQGLLTQLAGQKPAYRDDAIYQLWQEGSHPQRIQDAAMMDQKVMYIHHNPVRRGYVDAPEHWRYSSARDMVGMTGLLPLAWEGSDGGLRVS